MKNVERYAERYAKKYAQDKVDEANEKIIINLKNHGLTIEEILEIVNVSKEFVEKTLSN